NEKVYKLSNGFANVFKNSLRLSKGKYGSLTEDSTVFDEINQENNRSSEHVEDPRRTYRQRSSYGSGGSYGGSSSYGRSSNRGRSSDRSSGRRSRW
ncbi:MAG: hypothetical protein ACTSW1_11890, partial [Candidatus Hodarchaeales archaeon]